VESIPDDEAILSIDGVTVSYAGTADRTAVLEGITFALARRTWTTCLGPSGCGKSTLLRAIAGLIDPDRGTVEVPRNSAGVPEVAYLPQRDTLLPWRSALRNAVLASEIDGQPLGDALDEARRLFERFGLGGAERQYPYQLSGGMRQRVAVIRTYLAHRDLLLLDEPLGALDPLTRADLQEWLLEVWGELGKTVLLVTHDVEEALVLSDRVLVMSARPATIREDLELGLPRPRSRVNTAFVRQKEVLLGLLTGRAA